MKCKFKKDVEIAVKANGNTGAFIHPDNFYEIANNDYYSIEISCFFICH